MAYTGMTQTVPGSLPRTIDPSTGLDELNPIRPPGQSLDGTAHLHPPRSGNYAAVQHTQTLTLGGSWATDDVITVTITPTLTGAGVVAADGFVPIAITATVVATETATAAGALLTAAALASGTVSSLATVGDETRLREICTVTDAAGVVTFTAVNPGATFTVSYVISVGSGTAVVATSVDAAQSNLRVGTFVARDGVASDGRTPKVRALTTGDVESDIYGIVADGDRAVAIDPDAGYTYRGYRPGRDVPILPLEGAWTVYSEAAVDYFDDIWVRAIATGTEVAGAANDSPDYTAEVVTLTPTAANTTLYDGSISVYDDKGNLLATTIYSYTSDASGTATEICDGIRVDVDAGDVASYLASSGTATCILTASAAGYKIVHEGGSAAGVVAAVLTTAAATDHIRLSKGKICLTTTAAGTTAVDFGL